mmetsp:Transcript_14511/g.26092  ORF Transcript_14511/g.26092 Transcript_14511/m.26092 type:complete len:284 (-) Transcript_14511:195-1046(-)
MQQVPNRFTWSDTEAVASTFHLRMRVARALLRGIDSISRSRAHIVATDLSFSFREQQLTRNVIPTDNVKADADPYALEVHLVFACRDLWSDAVPNVNFMHVPLRKLGLPQRMAQDWRFYLDLLTSALPAHATIMCDNIDFSSHANNESFAVQMKWRLRCSHHHCLLRPHRTSIRHRTDAFFTDARGRHPRNVRACTLGARRSTLMDSKDVPVAMTFDAADRKRLANQDNKQNPVPSEMHPVRLDANNPGRDIGASSDPENDILAAAVAANETDSSSSKSNQVE